jgi:glycosyltransferase involved in cell wall biosynthesis
MGQTAGKLRVLVVTNMWPSLDRPAFGSFVEAQVTSLRSAGIGIDVHVIRGDSHPSAYLTSVPAIIRHARDFGADLVHAHYGLAGWSASFVPRPLVVSFCGDDLLGTPDMAGRPTWKSRIAVRMSHRAARRADAIICKSENLRQALPSLADRKRAEVIPNGVDLSRFRPGDRQEARARLGLAPDTPFVLFPHSTEQRAQKRFDLAAAAVAAAGQQYPGVQLLTVSGVPHQNMPDWYRAADCFLLTSRTEGSPNTVKEALACGLPVVTVDVGDVRRWTERVPGCEIAEPDPASLADAITRVLQRGERVDPAAVIDELGQQVAASRVMDVYRSAVSA